MEAEVCQDSGHLPWGGFAVCPKAGKERCPLPEVHRTDPGQGAAGLVQVRLGGSFPVRLCRFVRLSWLYLQRVKWVWTVNGCPGAGERRLSVIRGEAQQLAGC